MKWLNKLFLYISFVGMVIASSCANTSMKTGNLRAEMKECERPETYEQVKGRLFSADKAIVDERYLDVNTILLEGIEALGSQYAGKSTIDDTEMKLTLATLEAAKGNAEVAAGIRRNVLAARLDMFKALLDCN